MLNLSIPMQNNQIVLAWWRINFHVIYIPSDNYFIVTETDTHRKKIRCRSVNHNIEMEQDYYRLLDKLIYCKMFFNWHQADETICDLLTSVIEIYSSRLFTYAYILSNHYRNKDITGILLCTTDHSDVFIYKCVVGMSVSASLRVCWHAHTHWTRALNILLKAWT